MAELKTKQARTSVTSFLNTIEEPGQRRDERKIAAIMRDVTGSKARMWGTSMIGFGHYDYKYESGREGRWFLCGVSPRKKSLSLYIMAGLLREKTAESTACIATCRITIAGSLKRLARAISAPGQSTPGTADGMMAPKIQCCSQIWL